MCVCVCVFRHFNTVAFLYVLVWVKELAVLECVFRVTYRYQEWWK